MKSFINNYLIKLLSVILFISAIFSSNVFYAEDVLYTDGDFQYYLIDDAIVIAKYLGEDKNVKIPYNFGPYEVRRISSSAFVDTPARTVTLYDNTYYEDGAFDGIAFTYIDLNGNKTDDPSVNPSDVSLEEKKPSGTDNTQNENTSGFEDIDVDISEEISQSNNEDATSNITSQEEKQEKDAKKVRNRSFYIFDSSEFASDFKAKPIGYIFIGISIVVLIIFFRLYIKSSHIR